MKIKILKTIFFMVLGVCVWFAGVWIGDISIPTERGVYMLSFVLTTIGSAFVGSLIPFMWGSGG